LVPLRIRHFRERLELGALPRIACDPRSLAATSVEELREIFQSRSLDQEWSREERDLSSFQITENADGVNRGDRRAIYYLLRGLGARSALEIGTHIGASTAYTAAALVLNCSIASGESPRLTTVDVIDVNDEESGPWKRRGSMNSPRAIISKMGAASWVNFVKAASLDYFQRCTERFDFIFLDGDHTGKTVYREIPAALGLLNSGGAILLHDYFPEAKALWAGRAPIRGPWLATERLRSEGVGIRALPFGELPWPTKEGSRVSSLALLVGTPC